MDIKQFIRIKLLSSEEVESGRATSLAHELRLPPPAFAPDKVPFYLAYNQNRLELIDTVSGYTSSVDFLSAQFQYRLRTNRSINQHLLKAVGIKQGVRPTICDVTAGYGIDGFYLASFGCKVTMIERYPAVWALLRDGLLRAADDSRTALIVKNNISLLRGDARDVLTHHNRRFDTIYLDPMYPHRRKSALNKQKMRVLKSLVGDDRDQMRLFEAAKNYAVGRIVVKRPLTAPLIGKQSPSYQVKAQSSRYDVYLAIHL